MLSRRDFLRLTALLPSGLALSGAPISGWVSRAYAPAFGLYFGAAEVDRLRERFSSDMFSELREQLRQLDRAAFRTFLTSEVRYNDHLYHIDRVTKTAQQLAFLYAVAGDEEAADLSIEAMRTLMKFPRWDYFLEGGDRVFGLQRAPDSVLAVSLCSDWLGDRVTDSERDEWLRTMGERGLEASFLGIYGMRYPDRVKGWTMDETSTYFEHRPGDRIDLSNWPYILDKTNLKAVPASALAIGTATYQKRFGVSPDTERWLEQAVFSLRSLEDLFARDGSYPEGVSYGNYTALHLAQATTVLRRLIGIDLFDVINWTGHVEYVREMTMPTVENPKAVVNFGDAFGPAQSAVPFWVAGRAYDPIAQWTGLHQNRSHDTWSLIWYDENLPVGPPLESTRLWLSDLDWIVARNGYDTNDLVVAMRSGPPQNHEHADRGSLIVKAYGEMLVADPHRPPYSYSDPSWMMRTTAGHSAVLIDGQGHQYHDGKEGTNASDALAHITRTLEREHLLAWTSDQTPAYRMVNDDVASVTRTVVVLHELPAVLVVDKVVKKARPSRIQARYFCFNNDGKGRVETSGSTFRIMRPGASLRGLTFALGDTTVRSLTLPIPQEVAVMHPFAEVETQEAALTPTLLTVLLPEQGAAETATAEVYPVSEGVYMLDVRNGSKRARVTFADSGTIPEYKVEV